MLRNAAVGVFFVWILVDSALVFRHKTTAAPTAAPGERCRACCRRTWRLLPGVS